MCAFLFDACLQIEVEIESALPFNLLFARAFALEEVVMLVNAVSRSCSGCDNVFANRIVIWNFSWETSLLEWPYAQIARSHSGSDLLIPHNRSAARKRGANAINRYRNRSERGTQTHDAESKHHSELDFKQRLPFGHAMLRESD